MNTNLLLTFIISNIGFLIFVRRTTHQSAVYTSVLVSSRSSAIGATIFCLLFICFDDSPMLLTILIGVFLLFLSFVPKYLHRRAENIFFDNMPSNLEMIILAMKSGHSMKNSIKMMIETTNYRGKIIWHAILSEIESGHDSSITRTRFSDFVRDLKSVHWQKAKTIESLKSLHRHHSTLKYFRHRSRQATLQGRVQGGLLTLFFIPAIFYQIVSKPGENIELIITSVTFFGIGLFISINIGRFKQWKI